MSPSSVWIVSRKSPSQARLRLFCFPHAGGGAAIYRLWPDNFPSDINVCRVQLPGRERRLAEAPFTRLSDLVDALAPVLRPYMDIPFAVFGHSMGAVIGFALAHELRTLYGVNPAHLFVASHRAPQLPQPDPIHQLQDDRLLAALRQRYDGIPAVAQQNEELMELILPVLRADLELCETYVYKDVEPLDCPISALGGQQDDEVSCEDLSAWHTHTKAEFSKKVFPGGHLFLQSDPTTLLQYMAVELKRVLGQIVD